MRATLRIVALLVVLAPAVASAQSFTVNGAAGPTLVDRGYSVAAGAGFLLNPRVTVQLGLERSHLSTRTRADGRGGGSVFRGGTVTYGSAELGVSLFNRDRVTPYGLAGFAVGISHPTINASFPNRVTNEVRAVFFGGGIHVPIRDRLSAFADARMVVGGEAGETLALVPIRAGIGWRF